MNSEEWQEHIWQALANIPSGYVVTYGQLAQWVGTPNLARAVGRTLSRLPQDTRLPWHRVINAAGKLSFPEGSAPFLKQKSRLEKEGIVFNNGKICLKTYQWKQV